MLRPASAIPKVPRPQPRRVKFDLVETNSDWRPLRPKHFLDFSDLLLHPAFDLFRLAVGLQPGVSDRLAGDFLDAPGDFFGGSFCFVLGARFHFEFYF